MENIMDTMITKPTVGIGTLAEQIEALSTKVQSVFSKAIAENKILKLNKLTRTVELSNGVYQAERQSYGLHLDDELGMEVKSACEVLQAEGRARKDAKAIQTGIQIRVENKGTLFTVFSCNNLFGPYTAIFTVDNSELSSARMTGGNQFEAEVEAYKKAVHVQKLEVEAPKSAVSAETSKAF